MKENIFDFDIEEFKIGKATVEHIDFPSFYGLQKVQTPIYVYRASKEISPCVVVTACIHGDEINGVRIAQSLMKSKLKLLKGTLVILPIVNIYGFMNKVRYLPDRKDLNRCFPGLEKGSFGGRFADFIFSNLTKYGDIFIDLHSGSQGRYNIPQIRCDLSLKRVQELVDSISVPVIVNSSLRDGSYREAINAIDKPCIVFEGGEGLRIDESITRYGKNLVKSVLSEQGMIKSKKVYNNEKIIIKKTKWLRAKEGGLLINKAVRGKIVKKGEILGELRNISGELISQIRIEEDGVVLGQSMASMIMTGDALYNIGYMKGQFSVEEEDLADVFDIEL